MHGSLTPPFPRTVSQLSDTYSYTHHLVALDSCCQSQPAVLPASLQRVTTPLKANRWEEALRNHTDQAFASYITNGIRYGFRIGYRYPAYHHVPASSNMQSALSNPKIVQDYISREVEAG